MCKMMRTTQKQVRILLFSLTILLGVTILRYNGFSQEFLRGSFGDVLAVFAIGISIGGVFRKAWVGSLIGFGIGVLVELFQIGAEARGSIETLLWGSTFDFFDLVAYGIGAGLSAMGERWIRMRK